MPWDDPSSRFRMSRLRSIDALARELRVAVLGLVLSLLPREVVAQKPAVTVSPSAVSSGYPASLRIDLGVPAPKAGVTLSLRSGLPAVADFAATGTGSHTITVPAGQQTASVALRTKAVAALTRTVLTVSFLDKTLRAALEVRPLLPARVVTTHSAVYTRVLGEFVGVTLAEPAPAEGLRLQVVLSPGNQPSVPVTVPAGATTARVTTSIQPVTQFTPAVVGATHADLPLEEARGLIGATAAPAVAPIFLYPSPEILSITPSGRTLWEQNIGFRVRLAYPTGASGAPVPGPTFIAVRPSGVSAQHFQEHSSTFTYGQGEVVLPARVLSPPPGELTGYSVSIGSAFKTGSLELVRPVQRVLSLAPARRTIAPGDTVPVTVTLERPAGPGGLPVRVSALPSARVLSGGAVIPEGAQTGIATVIADGTISSPITLRISTPELTPGGVLAPDGSVTVRLPSSTLVTTEVQVAPVFHTVSVQPARTTIASGDTVTVTVTIDRPAPTGGLTIPLTSTVPLALTVPARLTVLAGRSTATFLAQAQPTVSQATTVNISAAGTPSLGTLVDGNSTTIAAGEGISSAAVRIIPLRVAVLSFNPHPVFGGQGDVELTVGLSDAAPTARTVALRLDESPVSSTCTVPPILTVVAGSREVRHRLTTQPVTGSSAVACKVSAELQGTTISAASPSTTLLVNPLPTSLSVETSNTEFIGGGALTGQVRFSATSTLQLSSGTAATVPLTITSDNAAVRGTTVSVPAGVASVSFSLGTVAVDAPTRAHLTFTVAGVSTALDVMLTPPPPRVIALRLSRTSVLGGDSVDATVELDRAVSGAPLPITMRSRSLTVTLPSSVQVPVGATRVTVRAATRPVSAPEVVGLSAVGSGNLATLVNALLTVEPLILASATLDQPVMFGNVQRPVFTVRLNGRAPVGGATVSLSSTLPGLATAAGVRLPTSVIIPAGSDQLAVTLITQRVAALTDAQLSAALIAPASVGGLVDGTSNTIAVVEQRATTVPMQLLPIPELMRVATDSASIAAGGTVNVLVEMAPVVTPTLRTATPPTLRLVITSANTTLVPRTTVQVPPGTSSLRIPLRVGTPTSDTPVSLTITMEVTRLSTPLLVRVSVPPSTPLQVPLP